MVTNCAAWVTGALATVAVTANAVSHFMGFISYLLFVGEKTV